MIATGGRRARWSPTLLAGFVWLASGMTHESPLETTPLEVEISGCGAVLKGPICELAEDRKVRLWVGAADGTSFEVRAGGVKLAARATPVQGGIALDMEAPEGARGLSILAATATGQRRFALRLVPARPAAAVREAERLRKHGELDAAAALLAGPARDPDAGTRGRAIAELARVDLARGRTDEGIARLGEAARLAAEAGRVSDEVIARAALAYTLTYSGRRFTEARAALAPRASAGGPGAAAWAPLHEGLPFYEGMLAFETGDLRAALGLLREAARRAERLGSESYLIAALQLEAEVLHLLGREAEGEAQLREAERMLRPDADACTRAGLLNNIGWSGILAARDGERPERAAPAARTLEEAARLYAEGGCPKPWARINVLTNLAITALYAGDPDGARRRVEEARAQGAAADERITVWWLDLDGRIALASGHPEGALEAYDRLAQQARRGYLPAAQWRAALGRAEALEALGRAGEARDAYVEAEALVDAHSLLVPFGEGRESFFGRFDESARAYLRFLLHRDVAAAADAARRSRARALATLRWTDRIAALSPEARARWEAALAVYRTERDALEAEAREDWRLPEARLAAARGAREARAARVAAALEAALSLIGGEQRRGPLPPPREGELFLVYHPIPGGYAGFAMTSERVEAREILRLPDGASPSALSELLLEPFRPTIDAAKRIHVLASGALARVDFHALPWGSGPLLARAPVVYGVDRPGAPRPREAAREALVVSDPRGDLPGARREAQQIAALWRARGYRVRVLDSETATHHALREALESPTMELFHYAGHGVFGGRDGWESALPLAGGGWLTVGDVLALARVPRRVILSGCETARSGADAPVQALGLGQAFVLAGAEAVVAATRAVDDRLAARLMAAFNAAGTDGPDPIAEALRGAQLAARAEAPASDWASFRVLVP